MPAGIEVINDGGRLQITSEMRHPAMIQSGRVSGPGGVWSTQQVFFAQHHGSCPLLLLRPDPGAWVGGHSMYSDHFLLACGGGCDYALFSNEGAPVSWGDGAGIQIFDGSGNLTFSSAYRFARIKNIVQHVFPGGGGETRQEIGTGVGLDEFGRRPWVVAADFTLSRETGNGEGSSFPAFGYTMEMPGNGDTLIVGWRHADDWSTWANWSDIKHRDIYDVRPMNIPLCHIPAI
jgi:hypothetical protein